MAYKLKRARWTFALELHFLCCLVLESNEEVLLKQALEMSMEPDSETPSADFAMMSEDEQIAYAMRMSLQAEGAV